MVVSCLMKSMMLSSFSKNFSAICLNLAESVFYRRWQMLDTIM